MAVWYELPKRGKPPEGPRRDGTGRGETLLEHEYPYVTSRARSGEDSARAREQRVPRSLSPELARFLVLGEGSPLVYQSC